MKKIVFTGCSFTAGNGWVDALPEKSQSIECKDYPELWVNLCHTQLDQLNKLELVNLGVGGASNTEIFENTVQAIGEYADNIDTIFCQWTVMPRYRFNAGLELWATTESIQVNGRSKDDVRLSDGTVWTRKYLDDLLNRLNVLHHLHGEILKVVKYTNVLRALASTHNIKIYFVNGLCPWDQNYFVRLNDFLPEDLTPFTKTDILNIKSRSDSDINKLYKIMHDNYDTKGGIDPLCWVNLYSSMGANKIDTNYDNEHPGVKSNQLYFQQVKNFLEAQ
jgi:hypothetical protein